MNPKWKTKNGLTSKRGAFLDGIWHCDCEPRLPADKFQTKNGGKNHGRWFYTCQKPQPKRCGFFLWSDEAKVREEGAILNNSRSEPSIPEAEPQTPKKRQTTLQAPITPSTKGTIHRAKSPSHPAHPIPSDEDSFDWPSSGDEDLLSVADTTVSQPSPTFETPRKIARTEHFSSPGKRALTDTLESNNDVFSTPSTSSKNHNLLSPKDTTMRKPVQCEPENPGNDYSDLTRDALNILKSANIPLSLLNELATLLDRHDLRTLGISRGRDIARIAVQTREKTIAELQSRISGLEAERETNRAVIAHLKSDMGASSPKKGVRGFPGRRSEV